MKSQQRIVRNPFPTREDARGFVIRAGLIGEWYPCGTGQGFADWLYLFGQEKDLRLLSGLRRGYIATWMEYSTSGANALFAEEAAKREAKSLRNEKVSREASTLVTQLKSSSCGDLAFSALRALATSAGTSMGSRKHTVASLERLKEFLEQLRKVFGQLDQSTVLYALRRFPSLRPRDWANFGWVEQQLREHALHLDNATQQSVWQLIAVCTQEEARAVLERHLTTLRMRAVIDSRAAPASVAVPRRRSRML